MFSASICLRPSTSTLSLWRLAMARACWPGRSGCRYWTAGCQGRGSVPCHWRQPCRAPRPGSRLGVVAVHGQHHLAQRRLVGSGALAVGALEARMTLQQAVARIAHERDGGDDGPADVALLRRLLRQAPSAEAARVADKARTAVRTASVKALSLKSASLPRPTSSTRARRRRPLRAASAACRACLRSRLVSATVRPSPWLPRRGPWPRPPDSVLRTRRPPGSQSWLPGNHFGRLCSNPGLLC